jgi:hypothetical protein
MAFNGSIDTLGDVVKMFVDCQFQMMINKDERDVITSIEGGEYPHRLLRNIRKTASQVMFTAKGLRRPLREASLKKKFNFEVVCIEENEIEWLTLGIKTPIGIIVYELH